MDTWILQMCRRSCIRQLLAWALTLAIGLIICTLNVRYIYNFLKGPFPVDATELRRVGDAAAAQRYFVTVSGSRTIDTGVHEVSVRKRGETEVNRSVSADYYGLEVGEKFLIVKSSLGRPTAVEGELAPIPSDLDHLLFDPFPSHLRRDQLYPLYLDAGWFRFRGYCGIAAALIFFTVFFLNGYPAWRHLQCLSAHPVVARVASWGNPIALASEIEKEFKARQFASSGNWTFADHYLIKSSLFAFDVLRFRDLLWAYKRVTKKSVNFIPTGKDYDAILVCYGGGAVIPGSEKYVDEVLRCALSRAPWAFFGHSKTIEKHFNEQTRDFCLAVEARKQEVLRQATTTRAERD